MTLAGSSILSSHSMSDGQKSMRSVRSNSSISSIWQSIRWRLSALVVTTSGLHDSTVGASPLVSPIANSNIGPSVGMSIKASSETSPGCSFASSQNNSIIVGLRMQSIISIL
uniref:Uncharacterized protein n=1 Tax=Anopheles atroparvus TaxID=41427 RepID=A0AAG5CVB9_ANOAO